MSINIWKTVRPKEMKRALKKRTIVLVCIFQLSFSLVGQEVEDMGSGNFQFSGSLGINTNGIATVPAFTLDKPSIVGVLSLNKNRFGLDQYLAYSVEGKPWFVETYFNYKLVDRKKFNFSTSAMWGVGYTHPEVFLDGRLRTITKAERYVFLILSATHELSKKVSFSFSTYHGYGFPEGSIRWATFVSLVGSIPQLSLGRSLYVGLLPQLLFINLDWETDAFFIAGKFGIGLKRFPLFFSTRISQPLTGNLSPDPGLKWNIGLSYNF